MFGVIYYNIQWPKQTFAIKQPKSFFALFSRDREIVPEYTSCVLFQEMWSQGLTSFASAPLGTAAAGDECACQRGSASDVKMADGIEADENDEPSNRALAGILAASGTWGGIIKIVETLKFRLR